VRDDINSFRSAAPAAGRCRRSEGAGNASPQLLASALLAIQTEKTATPMKAPSPCSRIKGIRLMALDPPPGENPSAAQPTLAALTQRYRNQQENETSSDSR
jgi:hypothetical protein